MAPVSPGDSPSDLGRRIARHLIGGPQADISDERRQAGYLDCPQTTVVDVPARLDSIDHGIGLSPRHHALHVFHHGWVGVDGGERRTVLVGEAAEQEALGAKDRDAHESTLPRRTVRISGSGGNRTVVTKWGLRSGDALGRG